MNNATLDAAAKIASAKQAWFPVTQPPDRVDHSNDVGPNPGPSCDLLLTWYDDPKIYEVRAEWRNPDYEGGQGYFVLFMWNDQHQQASLPSPGRCNILGWRYA